MKTIIDISQVNQLKSEKITDIVLHSLGREVIPTTVLKVGACDGSLDDLLIGWIHGYNMNAIYVEPIPDRCEMLRETAKSLRGNISIFECAISDGEGTIEMCMIPKEFIGKYTPNGLYVHPALLGMSSVWPPKNGLTGEHDGKVLTEVGSRVQVPIRSLTSVLSEANPHQIDILSIDTEGHDWIVLRQFDFTKYTPYWIEIEVLNLKGDERKLVADLLKQNGYILYGGIDAENVKDLYAIHQNCINWSK